MATSRAVSQLCTALLLSVALTYPARCSSSIVKRSDDLDLETLHDVVQQQAAAIQTLQAQQAAYAAVKTDVDILKAKDKTVAFTVRFNADSETDGLFLGNHNTLQFDHVLTNIGDGYNPTSGLFTAPVDGAYVFFLTIMSTDAHDAIDIVIQKTGEVLDLVYAAGNADIRDQGSGQVTTHLDAGQQVWVRQNKGDAIRGAWYTVFTGYLLHAQ